MANLVSFLAVVLVGAAGAAGVVQAQAIAAGQGIGCVAPSADAGADRAGETPIFTGSDHDNRVFTLTQNKETGAWTLMMIGEFEKGEGGLEIGIPCVVAAGKDSKLLDAVPPAEAVAGDGSPAPDGTTSGETVAVAPAEAGGETSAGGEAGDETYRVTELASDEVLDIRTGPGTDFESIAQVPPDGAGVAVTADSCKAVDGYRHPWCEVAWEGHKGWASACCLESERTGLRLE